MEGPSSDVNLSGTLIAPVFKNRAFAVQQLRVECRRPSARAHSYVV